VESAFVVQTHAVFVCNAEFLLDFEIFDKAGFLAVFHKHAGDAFVFAFFHGEGNDVVIGVGGEGVVGLEVAADAVDVAVHGPGHGIAQ